jgi:hypothetical protein
MTSHLVLALLVLAGSQLTLSRDLDPVRGRAERRRCRWIAAGAVLGAVLAVLAQAPWGPR